MLKHTFLSTEGILILVPSGPLETADFKAVINDIANVLISDAFGSAGSHR